MSCEHIDVIVTPDRIKKVTLDGEDGYAIDLYGGGRLSCRNCQEELHYEDMSLYEKEHISVGIPVEMVENDD